MLAKSHIGKVFKRWDRYLLQNHPRLWALRLPALGVSFVCFNLLAVTISLGFPLKAYHVTKFFYWLRVFGIVELIALGFWIRRFNWFSPEKALIKTSSLSGLVEIIVYMFCIIAFLSPTITSSVILGNRFNKIAIGSGVDHDFARVSILNTGDIYPRDLVEEYTHFAYISYKEQININQNVRTKVNRDLKNVVFKLYAFKYHGEMEWSGFLSKMASLLHISVFMFVVRHTFNGLVGKSAVYGILIIFSMEILQGLGTGFLELFTRYDYYKYRECVRNGLMAFLLFFVLFCSVRIYWQKAYKTFSAMNVSLLPYVIFFELLYWGDDLKFLEVVFGWVGVLEKTIGEFWRYFVILLILKSPLLIAWVFIFTKSMYMRLLAQPEG